MSATSKAWVRWLRGCSACQFWEKFGLQFSEASSNIVIPLRVVASVWHLPLWMGKLAPRSMLLWHVSSFMLKKIRKLREMFGVKLQSALRNSSVDLVADEDAFFTYAHLYIYIYIYIYIYTGHIYNTALCAYINIHCPAMEAAAPTVFMVWLDQIVWWR